MHASTETCKAESEFKIQNLLRLDLYEVIAEVVFADITKTWIKSTVRINILRLNIICNPNSKFLSSCLRSWVWTHSLIS